VGERVSVNYRAFVELEIAKCAAKKRYRDEFTAERIAKTLVFFTGDAARAAYHCRWCHGFHLTSTEPKTRGG
jgi:hypothetical protein